MDMNQIVNAMGSQYRISMLILMMEGRYFTAKELAYGSGLSPSAATPHLKILTDSQFVTCFNQGRFKYFTLFSPDVASFVESMIYLSEVTDIKRKIPEPDMCKARCCYNHVAGELGVELYNFFHCENIIHSGNDSKVITITDFGYTWLHNNKFRSGSLANRVSKVAFKCLDWSERKPHIGGHLGTVIFHYFLENELITTRKNSRIIDITPRGLGVLKTMFRVDI